MLTFPCISTEILNYLMTSHIKSGKSSGPNAGGGAEAAQMPLLGLMYGSRIDIQQLPPVCMVLGWELTHSTRDW